MKNQIQIHREIQKDIHIEINIHAYRFHIEKRKEIHIEIHIINYIYRNS